MHRRAHIAIPALAAALFTGAVALAAPATPGALPQVEVYKTPYCGCCGAWVTHLQQAGFSVKVQEVEDLTPLRARLGIPEAHASCHSAKIGSYVLEGHVPADDVKRLLEEKPQALGLAVPAMPAGAPGMDVPPEHAQAYATLLLRRDAPAQVYVQHPAGK
ncbi:periplasmic protein [Betaproteobacteria bacterium]|nr:periplasmic protein [Betaproteobacteria bacterium]GHT99896.1 periplasmic protein [Betaproteobacteria bacterium]GHU00667.1 periplasmic protein [Betaproteobacteria bacterium]GHU12285.1 periplasmic protein [Betaproteobacteria bacterium]GHU19727.1 periplasmic protein [Betaproteobacteria bacterium]